MGKEGGGKKERGQNIHGSEKENHFYERILTPPPTQKRKGKWASVGEKKKFEI